MSRYSEQVEERRSKDELTALRAEVARLTTEAASREAEYSAGLVAAAETVRDLQVSHSQVVEMYQGELVALVAECDAAKAERDEELARCERLRGDISTLGGECLLLRKERDAAREEQRACDVAAAEAYTEAWGDRPRGAVAAMSNAPLGATPLAERIKELAALVEFNEKAHAAALEHATAPCHGLGCGRCSDCVATEKAAHAATREELAETIEDLQIQLEDLRADADEPNASTALALLRAAPPGPVLLTPAQRTEALAGMESSILRMEAVDGLRERWDKAERDEHGDGCQCFVCALRDRAEAAESQLAALREKFGRVDDERIHQWGLAQAAESRVKELESELSKAHAWLDRSTCADLLREATVQRDALRVALEALTRWLSHWRHAVAISAEGGQEAWDELELAHNAGCAALAAAPVRCPACAHLSDEQRALASCGCLAAGPAPDAAPKFTRYFDQRLPCGHMPINHIGDACPSAPDAASTEAALMAVAERVREACKAEVGFVSWREDIDRIDLAAIVKVPPCSKVGWCSLHAVHHGEKQ